MKTGVLFAGLLAIVAGVVIVGLSLAGQDIFSIEAESNPNSQNTQTIDDDDASAGSFVQFTAPPPNDESFTFATAGDFGSDENAAAVLEGIGSRPSEFMLAVGDFAYDERGREERWCNFVKERVGEEYPFELLVGNHDVGPEGDILNFRECLPNRIDGLVGDYGFEYYFDYKGLARIIMVPPDISKPNLGYSRRDYEEGRRGYNWLSDTIDDARAQGLKWVVVGMHKNCISLATKDCEVGVDVMDLVIEKKVDLILQGHEHSYFRTKQLAFGPGCDTLVIDDTDTDCIVASGNDFTYGDGPILAIVGSGGRSLRLADPNDTEIGYFDTYSGIDGKESYGHLEVNISEARLQADFIPTNGEHNDSFTIR